MALNFPGNVHRKDRKLRAMVRQYGILPDLRGRFWQGVSPVSAQKGLFSYQSVLMNCLKRESKYAGQIEKVIFSCCKFSFFIIYFIVILFLFLFDY